MKLLATLILALGATIISSQSAASSSKASSTGSNITRSMASQRADRLFALLDMDHDGILTRNEVRLAGSRLIGERRASGHDVAPGIGGHTLRYFERAFETSSSVNKQQFEQVMLAHFDQMDRNHDGILTSAERQPYGRVVADQ